MYTAYQLPVSLLPDVPIPQISVHLDTPGMSARVTENSVTRPFRNQLLQLSGLEDIHSVSRNGGAMITLTLDYGSNMNLSFIEVNEKVDYAMSYMNFDLPRPRVVKGSISDIPVFHMAINTKNKDAVTSEALSNFTEQVIKRRLEQMDEVAFVDVHGVTRSRIIIEPDQHKLQAFHLSSETLESAISSANFEIGNIIIAEGQYEYQVAVGNQLSTIDDLKKIPINIGGSIIPLHEIANITQAPESRRGSYLYNGEEGILLSVRKKYNANNFSLKKNSRILLNDLEEKYPDISFQIVDDQSSILDLSYQNLRTALLLGMLFSSIILFFFFREWQLPLMIIITVPVSVLLSLLGFYLIGISMNIISISGLILGVGLMIDNGIIIIDNIRQELRTSEKDFAITKGTADVIRPLISSALTTISVFMPLILIGGIAGVLFFDQAISITIALTSSLVVSVFLLPVLAMLLMSPSKVQNTKDHERHHRLITYFIKHRWKLSLIFVVLSGLGILLMFTIEKEGFPPLTTEALEIAIDWNENITIAESERRIRQLQVDMEQDLSEISAIIGEQQFVINEEHTGMNEVRLLAYLDVPGNSGHVMEALRNYLRTTFPTAQYDVLPKRNTFDRVLVTSDYDLTAALRSTNSIQVPDFETLEEISPRIQSVVPDFTLPAKESFLRIIIKESLLPAMGLRYEDVRDQLLIAFSEKQITEIRGETTAIPLVLGTEAETTLEEIIQQGKVSNKNGNIIPLKNVISIERTSDYKYIHANVAGEYIEIPIIHYAPGIENKIRNALDEFTLSFDGAIYRNKEIIRQLVIILLVVFLLLFLILAAQFESLIQPILILIDVPLSLMGGLFLLWLFGSSLNLVSMVGLIITAGIIVNDAILKVDMINKNRKSGMDINHAIIEASSRRLRPIVMTSLTTILAFLPVLFSGGLGAELQKPMALAIIGGLVIGTLSSLVFLPVLYKIFISDHPKTKTTSKS